MRQKTEALSKIYDLFDTETADYRKGAACSKGCAFCCTDAASIDITTLEGLVIRENLGKMARSRQTGIKKALKRDMKKRESGIVTPCPFLMKTRACMIYEIRPFACRRIYSVHPCSKENPPLISRRVMVMAQKAITALQRLDENGYSGHLSFILHMLESPRFLETYLAGASRPEEVMAFGKTHRIVINKMVI